MMKAKTIGSILTLALLSACLSSQPTDRQSSTDSFDISTPTKVLPSETPAMSTTPETGLCISPPAKDSLLLQAVYPTDLAKYGISMKSRSEPILSPNKQYLALSLDEENRDSSVSHLAVLNLKENSATWFLEYQSVNWSGVEVAWSPNSQWVAFFPENVAFGDDGGLWIFDITAQRKYQQKRATSIVGWDEKSSKIYFDYKDAFGFVNVQDWEVTFGERCP